MSYVDDTLKQETYGDYHIIQKSDNDNTIDIYQYQATRYLGTTDILEAYYPNLIDQFTIENNTLMWDYLHNFGHIQIKTFIQPLPLRQFTANTQSTTDFDLINQGLTNYTIIIHIPLGLTIIE